MHHLLEDTGFWYFVSFTLFFLLLGRPVGKALVTLLDQKRAEIQKDLIEADQLYQEAQRLLTLSKEHHTQVEQKIDQVLKYAEEEIARLRDDTHQAFHDYAHSQEEQINDRINTLENTITAEISESLINTCMLTATKMVEERISNTISEKMIQDVHIAN